MSSPLLKLSLTSYHPEKFMGFVADAMWLIKIRKYHEAAKILEKHIDDSDLRQSSKSSLMSWTAECYLKADEKRTAGRWFELASRAVSEAKDLEENERQSRVMGELEQAMECYRAEDDIDGISRLASLRDSLMRKPNL